MVELKGYDRVTDRFLTLASCSSLVKSVLRGHESPRSRSLHFFLRISQHR